jgi:Spy/CpxP family protein refolding chaperone
MKTNKLNLKTVCLSLILLMISVTVFSQQGQEGKHPGQGQVSRMQQPDQPQQPQAPDQPRPPMGPGKCGPDHNMPPKLDIPDLSDEQQQQLKDMGTKHLQAMIPLKAQEGEKEARLVTLLTVTESDPKLISAAVDELGKVRTAMLKLAAEHDQAMRKILTPDQKVIFDLRPKPFLGPKD